MNVFVVLARYWAQLEIFLSEVCSQGVVSAQWLLTLCVVKLGWKNFSLDKNRSRGANNPSVYINSLGCNIGDALGCHKAGFEAGPLHLAKKVSRAILVSDGVEPPRSRLGITVPRNIQLGALLSLERNNGGCLVGKASPVVPEGSVVLSTDAEEARVHVGMEDGRAVGCILSQSSLRSPIDEDVSTRKNLRAALRLGKEVVRGKVARN